MTMQIATFNLFQTLIDYVCARDEAIAKDMDMALGITAFLQSLLNYTIVNKAFEEILAEFLLSLASLMKSTPGLLVKWFEFIEAFGGAPALSKKGDDLSDDENDKVIARKPSTPKQKGRATNLIQYNREFPMFYILIEYIHHEGNVGEYARTGLLYLIEVAAMSQPLVRWVIDSDLGAFMASGLGALYSQVCRTVAKDDWQNPSIIGVTIPEDATESNDMNKYGEYASTQDKDLHTFLSYLLFWQDMLKVLDDHEHRESDTNDDNCLDDLINHLMFNFDALFVRQLLYPSVVESSDVEGGYSSVLIEILATVLNSLDYGRLSQLIVCYFLGQSIKNPIVSERIRRRRRGSRSSDISSKSNSRPVSKSNSNLLRSGLNDNRPVSSSSNSSFISIHTRPILTLEDIVRESLESNDTSKRACTLKLVSILVSKYYPYITEKLVPISTAIPHHVDGISTKHYKLVKIHVLEELEELETVLKVHLDIDEEDRQNDMSKNDSFKDDGIPLDGDLLDLYHQDAHHIALLQMRKVPSPQPQLLAQLSSRDLMNIEINRKMLKIMRPTPPKIHRLSRVGKSIIKADTIESADNPDPSSGDVLDPVNEDKTSISYGSATIAKNIIEIILCDMFPRFFDNGFAENLALTQVIARLGTCGWIDMRGWVLEEIVKTLKVLKEEYAEKGLLIQRDHTSIPLEESENAESPDRNQTKRRGSTSLENADSDYNSADKAKIIDNATEDQTGKELSDISDQQSPVESLHDAESGQSDSSPSLHALSFDEPENDNGIQNTLAEILDQDGDHENKHASMPIEDTYSGPTRKSNSPKVGFEELGEEPSSIHEMGLDAGNSNLDESLDSPTFNASDSEPSRPFTGDTANDDSGVFQPTMTLNEAESASDLPDTQPLQGSLTAKSLSLGKWVYDISTTPIRTGSQIVTRSITLLSLSSGLRSGSAHETSSFPVTTNPDSQQSQVDDDSEKQKRIEKAKKEDEEEEEEEEKRRQRKQDLELNLRAFYEFVHELYAIFVVRGELYDQQQNDKRTPTAATTTTTTNNTSASIGN